MASSGPETATALTVTVTTTEFSATATPDPTGGGTQTQTQRSSSSWSSNSANVRVLLISASVSVAILAAAALWWAYRKWGPRAGDGDDDDDDPTSGGAPKWPPTAAQLAGRRRTADDDARLVEYAGLRPVAIPGRGSASTPSSNSPRSPPATGGMAPHYYWDATDAASVPDRSSWLAAPQGARASLTGSTSAHDSAVACPDSPLAWRPVSPREWNVISSRPAPHARDDDSSVGASAVALAKGPAAAVTATRRGALGTLAGTNSAVGGSLLLPPSASAEFAGTTITASPTTAASLGSAATSAGASPPMPGANLAAAPRQRTSAIVTVRSLAQSTTGGSRTTVPSVATVAVGGQQPPQSPLYDRQQQDQISTSPAAEETRCAPPPPPPAPGTPVDLTRTFTVRLPADSDSEDEGDGQDLGTMATATRATPPPPPLPVAPPVAPQEARLSRTSAQMHFPVVPTRTTAPRETSVHMSPPTSPQPRIAPPPPESISEWGPAQRHPPPRAKWQVVSPPTARGRRRATFEARPAKRTAHVAPCRRAILNR
ncbi:hypothetical protein AMAG_05611 [Allomyces macrogynus ATCC 38327]|uniref:Uncharacterized protein n=1 Tax=Allomyces macrogynus (strain ATCC 38327) TaxID=578462 RepID=A0A0L0SCM8_ALLM3|nr:hypothetical protein AMAG_05611 [Allomyces macrogynus ATCC 38327]|eukprot:KNE60192.1 hypothetical protein AMAG_05611 [Allomyces macrogynus ATCC 38327]